MNKNLQNRDSRIKATAKAILKDIEESEDPVKAKQEHFEILRELSNRKIKSCIKNGKFDYIKMSQLYHSGQW